MSVSLQATPSCIRTHVTWVPLAGVLIFHVNIDTGSFHPGDTTPKQLHTEEFILVTKLENVLESQIKRRTGENKQHAKPMANCVL